MKKTTNHYDDRTEAEFIRRVKDFHSSVILTIFAIAIVPGGFFMPTSASGKGLAAAGNQLWSQDSADIEGICEPQDRFGYALSSGDYNGDGYAGLAIGVPQENIGQWGNAGAINVLYGERTRSMPWMLLLINEE